MSKFIIGVFCGFVYCAGIWLTYNESSYMNRCRVNQVDPATNVMFSAFWPVVVPMVGFVAVFAGDDSIFSCGSSSAKILR